MESNREKIEEESAELYIKLATDNYKYYIELAKEICREFIPDDRDLKILDIGTGPGFLPLEIAARRPRVTICGIDLTRKMIEYTRKLLKAAEKIGRCKKGQLHFCLADGNQLPFSNSSFDIVISTGALHAFRDPVRVLNECHRVLRPNGLCIIYDPVRFCIDDKSLSRLSLKDVWHRCLIKKRIHRKPIIPKCYSAEKVAAFVKQSKFKIAEEIQKNELLDYLKIVLRK